MMLEKVISARKQNICSSLGSISNSLFRSPLIEEGTLTRIIGSKLEATGCEAAIGSRCKITTDETSIEAEVVGFSNGKLLLMPEGSLYGVKLGARVIPLSTGGVVAVDQQLLGRVVDGGGKPIDGKGSLKCNHHVPLKGQPINPLQRTPIKEPLDVGVRAINGLLTIGKGQRLGLFAGSGVGKSTLLGMMTRHTEADVIVVALIGERGREVREFVDEILGAEGLAKAIVVATPADDSPLMRVHATWRATAIAEHFKHKGKNVLLLMDSLTRVAQAQREIGLAVGEPPVSKGYPPSVFSLLPSLVERAGNGADDEGSITAIYTVLVEGDDHNEPIADAARSILDGHIVLSRHIADSGLFPAIDVDSSVSRSMMNIVNGEHLMAARSMKKHYAVYQQNSDLINIGAYQQGSDESIDQAIVAIPHIRNFVQQERLEKVTLEQSIAGLQMVDNLFNPAFNPAPEMVASPVVEER